MNKTIDNPSKKTIKNREFRATHPQYDAEWRNKNRDKLRKQSREYYQRHIEKERLRATIKNHKRRKENPEREKEYCKKSDTKRMSNTMIKLHRYIGNHVRYSLINGKKKNKKLEDILDFSVESLKKHLEKQFQDGMTWENYGKYGWHIDHIIPVSVFNYETQDDIDFKRCWALNNLQPMWAIDNIRKHNKLSKPFQPSLPISVNEAI
jgi:hypothetical protein